MSFSSWIIGPQLIGFIFSLVGLVMLVYPPKKINGLDIYLTSSVEKNKLILNEAKRFLPRYLLQLSLIVFISGIAITAILKIIITSAQLQEVLGLMFLLISMSLSMAIVIAKTGRHLEKKFNNKDEIR